jgi:hypothetical protein
MSAMEDIPYQWVFAGQVREIQGQYPQAHQALMNWGNWSRRLCIKPFLCRPALWNMVKADREEWGEEPKQKEDEIENQVDRKRSEPLQEVGRDPSEEPKPDDKLGRAIDVLIHATEFPPALRNILRASYFTRVPEYQMPLEAGLKPPFHYDSFLALLDGALHQIQGVLDGSMEAR